MPVKLSDNSVYIGSKMSKTHEVEEWGLFLMLDMR